MVFLSELSLDPRRRGVLRAAADSYAMHQLVSMGFPDGDRGSLGRVLYRVETQGGRLRVLVQSSAMPDWSRLEDVLLGERGPKEVKLRRPDGSPVFTSGQILRFRLRANPTVRAGASAGALAGKRVGIAGRAAQLAWLGRKAVASGFELVPLPDGPEWIDAFEDGPASRAEVRATPLDWGRGHKPKEGDSHFHIQHVGTQFDGALRVVDPARVVSAIEDGIGSGKAFGFGLLSVAPIRA
jgi:CRISPR system Cascade subunit CasE